ncbi:hypothetical protein GCM10023264_02410 [Sphingomonas daechungensis]
MKSAQPSRKAAFASANVILRTGMLALEGLEEEMVVAGTETSLHTEGASRELPRGASLGRLSYQKIGIPTLGESTRVH